MKIILQRVKKASVIIDNKLHSSIEEGLVLFVGIAQNDDKADVAPIIEKIVNMRIFEDKDDKFDKSLIDIDGEILVVSQFTLFADTSKGRRPYFGEAAEPKMAKELYDLFVAKCKEIYHNEKVKSGKFAAKMLVEIHNEGPVTIEISTK